MCSQRSDVPDCRIITEQVRYLMRGINGEKLGKNVWMLEKYLQYKVYVE